MAETTENKGMRRRGAESEEARAAEAKPTGLAARVVKKGVAPRGMPTSQKLVGEPGLYEVVHGRLCLGHEDGDTVYADVGAHVELSAEEAGRMLAEGAVKKVA